MPSISRAELVFLLGVAWLASGNVQFAWAGASQLAPAKTTSLADFVHTWNPENTTLRCEIALDVTSHSPILTIQHNGTPLLVYELDVYTVSMYSSSENDPKLVYLGVSGSGVYRMVVFRYTSNKVERVLDVRSKLVPEVLYFGQDSEQSIVVSQMDWLKDDTSGRYTEKPSTADIYNWRGNSYVRTHIKKWEDRLRGR